LAIWALIASNATSVCAQYEGFTEPVRTIELASDESGIIQWMGVVEGARVRSGEIVARLSDDLQRVQFELAAHLAETDSAVVSAQEMLDKREAILVELQKLRQKEYASENEMLRAQMELEIARARLRTAEDEQKARRIEMRRAETQLKKREIAAPFDGIVAKIHRKQGEFLSPLRPELITLVDIQQLYATFNVASAEVSQLKIGQEVRLEIGRGQHCQAKVDQIGVQIDSRSGTVQIKLLIDNVDNKFRAGETCLLQL
jgi:RND family efflux transporter MFP subunit